MTKQNTTKEDIAVIKNELKHIAQFHKEIDAKLENILKETKKTNGRVSNLEWWRNALAWAFGGATTIGLVILTKLWQ